MEIMSLLKEIRMFITFRHPAWTSQAKGMAIGSIIAYALIALYVTQCLGRSLPLPTFL